MAAHFFGERKLRIDRRHQLGCFSIALGRPKEGDALGFTFLRFQTPFRRQDRCLLVLFCRDYLLRLLNLGFALNSTKLLRSVASPGSPTNRS